MRIGFTALASSRPLRLSNPIRLYYACPHVGNVVLKEDDADQLESGGRITEVGQGTELVNRGGGGSDARLARSGSHVSHDDNHGEDRGSVGNPSSTPSATASARDETGVPTATFPRH